MAKKIPLVPVATTLEVPADHQHPSAFGGTPLDEFFTDDALDQLRRHGIVDVEQLLSLATLADVRPFLNRLAPGMERFLNKVTEAMPAAAAMAEATMVPPMSFGAVLPPELSEASAVSFAELAPLPPPAGLASSANLISQMSRIKQQGARGTCVAFCLTSINEFVVRKTGDPQNLSEQHLYHETKLSDGFAPGVCGTSQAAAAAVLKSIGQCHELTWPYNPNPPCNNNGSLPAEARPEAVQWKRRLVPLQTFGQPANVNGAKAALASGRPVGFSVRVFNSWNSPDTRRTGRINRLPGETPISGHCMCAVGYQDDATYPGGGYFIMRNSWGPDWAPASPYGPGHGTLSYAYVAADCYEMYTLPEVTAADEVLVAPKVVDEAVPVEPLRSSRTITITIKPGVTGDIHLIIE